MKIATLCLTALLACPSPGMSSGTSSPGDFFLISRFSDGAFHGSHKLFLREADGLRKVTYCGRDLWVRPFTVAWTQNEAENRRFVQVEYNNGKGWHPLCSRAESEVTLADLGIELDAVEFMRSGPGYHARKNRFKIIMEAFSKGY